MSDNNKEFSKIDLDKAIVHKRTLTLPEIADYAKQGWAPAPATGLEAVLNVGLILGIGGAGLHGALVGADSHGHGFDAAHNIGNLPAFDSGPTMNGAYVEPYMRNDPPEQAGTMLVRGFVPADGSDEGTYGIVTLHPGSKQPIDFALVTDTRPGDTSEGVLLEGGTLVGGSNNWGNVTAAHKGGSVTRNGSGEITSGGELGTVGYVQHLDKKSTSWDSIAKLLADGDVDPTNPVYIDIKATFDKGEPVNIELINLGQDAKGDNNFQTRVANGDGEGLTGPQLKVSTEFSQKVADLIKGATRLKEKITKGFSGLASYNIGPDPVIKPSETSAPTATPENTATATEAAKVTLEDWEEIFSGSFIATNGKRSELSWVLDSNRYTLYTDPNQVRALPSGTEIFIFQPSGYIDVYSEPGPAADDVANGASVRVPIPPRTANTLAIFAIEAAKQAHANGRENIFVRFNESSITVYSNGIPIDLSKTIDQNGKTVIKMPKHFEVGREGKSYSLKDAGLVDLTEENWYQKVIAAGYTEIFVTAH